MKKIISLYQRNYDGDHLVRDEVVPGAEWVLAGEGAATRKYDGTCCLIRDRRLYKRFDLKPGKPPPPDFEVEQHDPVTGKSFGWVPVGDGPEDRWHRQAFERLTGRDRGGELDGTYELLGPKIQGNPERFTEHELVAHADAAVLPDAPRDFEGLRSYLAEAAIEGIVWHHPEGRMVKIKSRDFGLKRIPPPAPP